MIDMDMSVVVIMAFLTLEDMNNLTHQFGQSPTRPERCRNHRNTHQSTQRVDVQLVTTSLCLIKHIQRTDNSQVHVH